MFARLTISVLFCLFLLPTHARATAYYVDFSAACTGNGLATTSSFCSLDQFTEVARSAGDIAFVRRGTSTTTGMTDLTFTSDGTIPAPIIISADYDNLWSDFATSSQTYTINHGTTTLYASASVTGIAAGDWIYVEGDCGEIPTNTLSTTLNMCNFAYEVSFVSGNALGIHLPYKGNNTGSGKALRVMPDAPIRGAVTSNFQFSLFNTNNWLFKGLHVRGTDAEGQIVLDAADNGNVELMDMVLQGNGASDIGLQCGLGSNDTGCTFRIAKSRIINDNFAAIHIDDNAGIEDGKIYDTLLTASGGLRTTSSIGSALSLFDTTLSALTLNSPSATRVMVNHKIVGRNTIISSFLGFDTATHKNSTVQLQDINGNIGQSFRFEENQLSNTLPIAQSTTSNARPGGGANSILISPSTNISPSWQFSYIPLFEYPIYADTSSKQYDVYFMSTSTSGWTANPSASELWIECEYWAHATGASSTRKVKKSTGTIDFTGSTSWQNLSVTCQPSQTGLMYLRGWYAKTKETGKMNEFYVDGTPVIN